MSEVEQEPELKTTVRRGRAAVEKRANALQKLEITYVAINSVRPNSYNANRQNERDFDLLLRSMREDGFTQPIVVQRSTNEIVDGEHRWRAAREIGLTEIPVAYVDMTPEQMRIATLRHNRARGAEDLDLSAQLLRDLRELGALDWAADSLMIDDAALQKIMDDVQAPEDLAGEEFNNAWAPTRNVTLSTRDVGPSEKVDLTPASRAQQEATAKLQAAATTDKERVEIELTMRQENFRLVASFMDSEADLVRSVLDPNPAARILELCRQRDTAPAEAPAEGQA